jgi:hypothetical protein
VGVSSGIGDADDDRFRGLRPDGSLVPDEGVSEDADRPTGVLLAYGLGVVRVKGLKLWPTPMSAVLVELFQRGLLFRADSGREADPPTGVGMVDLPAAVADREPSGLRVAWLEGVGRRESLRFVCCAWLPAGPRPFLSILGVGVTGSIPRLAMITEDGGELPGVSRPLSTAERSLEIMLETESRSF